MNIRTRLGDSLFGVRVGAIIVRDGHVLLASNDKEDYYYTVGGGVMVGETAEEALRREVLEELGAEPVDARLIAIHENFWRVTRDSEAKVFGVPLDTGCHELCFFFLVDLPQEYTVDPDHTDPAAVPWVRESFTWIPLERVPQLSIFPTFLAGLVDGEEHGIRHIVTHE